MRLTTNQQVGDDYIAPRKPFAADSSEEMDIDHSLACAVLPDVQSNTGPTDDVRLSTDMVQQNELAAHVGTLHQPPPQAEGLEGILASATDPSEHFDQPIHFLTSAAAVAPPESSQASCVEEANRPTANAIVGPTEDEALALSAPQSQEDVDMALATPPAPADDPVDDSHLSGGQYVHSE